MREEIPFCDVFQLVLGGIIMSIGGIRVGLFSIIDILKPCVYVFVRCALLEASAIGVG